VRVTDNGQACRPALWSCGCYCQQGGDAGACDAGLPWRELWALAEACRSVHVVSSARGSLESFSKTLTGQGAPSQLRPSGPGERLPRCGTSVTMNGFLHQLRPPGAAR
jgi:hypothetical protein